MDVYITVDVFGTVYTRVDWFLANNEILRAKTAMEVFAVNTESGLVVMPPQAAVAEAEYNESAEKAVLAVLAAQFHPL